MYLTYIRRELHRRSKQAVVVALGLGIGIGLVITVSAASAGVKTAQASVLHSLYGIGTDMTVTKTASPGSGGPEHFGGFGGFGSGSGSRPAGGTHITRNTLRPTPGSATLDATDVSKVESLKGVAAVTGGLLLTDTSFSGTIPSFSGVRTASGTTATTGSAAPAGGTGGGPAFNISSFSVDGVSLSSSGVGPLAPSQVTKGKYFSSSDRSAKVAVGSASYASQNKLKVGSDITVSGKSLSVIGLAQVPSGSADVYIPLGTAQSLSGLSGKVTTIFVSAASATNVSSLASKVQRALPGTTVSTSADLASEVSGSLSSASNLAGSLGKWLSIAALLVAFILAGLLMMAAVSRRVREFGTLKAIGWRTRRIVEQVMGEGLAMGVLGGVVGIVLGIGGAAVISAISPSLTATVGSPFVTGNGFAGGGAGGRFSGGFGGGFGGSGSGSSASPGASGSGSAARGLGHAFTAAHSVLVHLSAPLQGDAIGLAVLLAVAGGLIAGAFGAWRAARLRPATALRRVE